MPTEVTVGNHLGSLCEAEDDVPQSLIENARKAEPHASQKDKYLPENFDVAQFNFKGPLVIEHKPVFTTVYLFVTQCGFYDRFYKRLYLYWIKSQICAENSPVPQKTTMKWKWACKSACFYFNFLTKSLYIYSLQVESLEYIYACMCAAHLRPCVCICACIKLNT